MTLANDPLLDDPAVLGDLTDQGRVFLTEVEADGKIYGYLIVADSWEEAAAVADQRGGGEAVIGRLIASRENKTN